MKKFGIFESVQVTSEDDREWLRYGYGMVTGTTAIPGIYIVALTDRIAPDGSTAVLVNAEHLTRPVKVSLPVSPTSAPVDVKPTPFPPFPDYPIPPISTDPDKWVQNPGRKFPPPMYPNEVVGQCSKCGRDMYQVDMYCCMSPGCPSRASWTC